MYEALQLTFNRFTFLIHFDKNRILFINVNAFKKHNFKIIMYHVKKKQISKRFKNFNNAHQRKINFVF